MNDSQAFWKKCSSCKKPISWNTVYHVCNVSTCNRKRTGLAFCSVSCWDAHVPLLNHRESWSEERRSPKSMEHERELEQGAQEARAKIRDFERLAREEEERAKLNTVRSSGPSVILRKRS
jgi:hypothetical protein